MVSGPRGCLLNSALAGRVDKLKGAGQSQVPTPEMCISPTLSGPSPCRRAFRVVFLALISFRRIDLFQTRWNGRGRSWCRWHRACVCLVAARSVAVPEDATPCEMQWGKE